MGCHLSKDSTGAAELELDIGSLQILISPTIGIQIKQALLTNLITNIANYTSHSQQVIHTLASTMATAPAAAAPALPAAP